MNRQFRAGVAAELDWYPPEERSPDGDVTATVYVSGETRFAGVWPAVLDADDLDEALTAAAAKGARALVVGNAAGVRIGERYLLTNEHGVTVPVSVVGKNSAGRVELDQELPIACGITGDGSHLRGWRHTLSLSAEQLATRRRGCRIELEYELDARTVRHVDWFDVVKRPFQLDLSETYIERLWSDFGRYRSADWRKNLEGAHDQIAGDLFEAGYEADRIVNPRPLLPWAACLVLEATQVELLSRRSDGGSERALAYWQGRVQAARQNVLSSPRTWYDADENLAGAPQGSGTFRDGGEWYDADGGEPSEAGLALPLVPVS